MVANIGGSFYQVIECYRVRYEWALERQILPTAAIRLSISRNSYSQFVAGRSLQIGHYLL